MSACRTDIDWSQKPAPWCFIGPKLRADCERIAKGKTPLPAYRPPSQHEVEGLALRDRRWALGLTQAQLGDRAGYDAREVSEAELGRGYPILIRTIEQALTQLEARLAAAQVVAT